MAYLGFIAVKVWLITKGISFGEVTLLSLFVFLAIYKIIVGYALKLKSSKIMGIWLIVISVFLIFINQIWTRNIYYYWKWIKIFKRIDERTTLTNLYIKGKNLEFGYYINNVSINNMTNETKKYFEYNV